MRHVIEAGLDPVRKLQDSYGCATIVERLWPPMRFVPPIRDLSRPALTVPRKANPPIEEGSFLISVNGKKLDRFGSGMNEEFVADRVAFTDLMWMTAGLFNDIEVETCFRGSLGSRVCRALHAAMQVAARSRRKPSAQLCAALGFERLGHERPVAW